MWRRWKRTVISLPSTAQGRHTGSGMSVSALRKRRLQSVWTGKLSASTADRGAPVTASRAVWKPVLIQWRKKGRQVRGGIPSGAGASRSSASRSSRARFRRISAARSTTSWAKGASGWAV